MHQFKNNRLVFSLLLASAGLALLINSCKKDNSDTVAYFLTTGSWKLASVTRKSFVGDTLKKTDTLYTTCSLTQLFKFTSDNTCSYTNYRCITQKSTGSWQLVSDDLILQTTLTADTGSTAKAKIFENGQIINLGGYSFVVQTGDTSPYYTSKTKRVITRFGFVHSTDQ